MALDASRVLGSPQLAAAKVWPRGQAWLTAARVNYSADAVLLAPLVARMMFGPRPDRSPAQTPRFGFAALIAVTKDELALVSLKARAPAGVIARVPLSEVKAFDLVGARGVWPLTITFGDGDIWRLEVPRRNKKAARAVAAVVSGQGQPSSPGSGPGYRPPWRGARHRARVILAIAGAVVAAGIAVGVLSSRGHGVAAPPGRSPAGTGHVVAAPSPARIGSSFDVQDGSGGTYRVTLVKLVDPAQGAAGPFDTPDSGMRFVGAVFRITAVTRSPKGDDAGNDAALVGSNGKTYTTDFNDIAGYADLDDGAIQVAPGGTTTGAVPFQVPDGVQVTEVQWTPANGFGATVAWTVGS
jgi:hypothetical protein